MNLSINTPASQMHFTYEFTRHNKGMIIWGDRRSFHELHELLGDCWDCESDGMSQAEACSYIGVISYFSYEVRHAFMGDRHVRLDGKPLKAWSEELFVVFEKEQERFEVGVEFSWPHMLFILAAWYECLKHRECPMRVLTVMHDIMEGMEQLLLQRSKTQYPTIEPYIHGAIYAANPYLMHTMEFVNHRYLQWSRFGRVSLNDLEKMMRYAAFGSWEYSGYMDGLKKQAKKLGCPIEELKASGDNSSYHVEL